MAKASALSVVRYSEQADKQNRAKAMTIADTGGLTSEPGTMQNCGSSYRQRTAVLL